MEMKTCQNYIKKIFEEILSSARHLHKLIFLTTVCLQKFQNKPTDVTQVVVNPHRPLNT